MNQEREELLELCEAIREQSLSETQWRRSARVVEERSDLHAGSTRTSCRWRGCSLSALTITARRGKGRPMTLDK